MVLTHTTNSMRRQQTRAYVANHCWHLSNTIAAHRFQSALANPQHAQSHILSTLIKKNASCTFAHTHNFHKIHNIDDYRKYVPLSTWDDYQESIHNIKNGSQQELCADTITRLIPTSGTSTANKLIPWTQNLKQGFNNAIAPWMHQLFRERPSLKHGTAYWSLSPQSDSEKFVGFEQDDQYLNPLSQYLLNHIFAVPSSLARVYSHERFFYLSCLHLLNQGNLRLISIWHPSFLDNLLGIISRHWDRLLHDLRHGTNDANDGLHSIAKNPRRSRALKNCQPSDYAQIWPHLQMISSWGDAHIHQHYCDLQEKFPHVLFQKKGLLATEGVFSIPYKGMFPLAIRSHLFEFIDDSGNCFLPHELKEGQQYKTVISNGAGLYRYQMADIIEVQGFIKNTPSISFVGRDACSDLVGEKLSDAFVGSVLKKHLPHQFASLRAHNVPGCYYYELITSTHASMENTCTKIEAELMNNVHYAWARHAGQLGSLRSYPIENTHDFLNELASQQSCRIGDIKLPALIGSTS